MKEGIKVKQSRHDDSLSNIVTGLKGMKAGQGEKIQTEHGAIRESNSGRGRFDLIPYESMEAFAIWSEQGAIKYGDRNWEKGLSVKDCINRLIRHALKAGSGWTDEDHLAAAMWNASAAITMMKRRPDCNDHAWVRKVGQSKITGDEYHNAGLDMDVTIDWHKDLVNQETSSEEIFTCPNCGGYDWKYRSPVDKSCDNCPWIEHE